MITSGGLPYKAFESLARSAEKVGVDEHTLAEMLYLPMFQDCLTRRDVLAVLRDKLRKSHRRYWQDTAPHRFGKFAQAAIALRGIS